MNKQQYRVSRRLVRDNGQYALSWMSREARDVWEQLIYQGKDWLQERANIIQYCQREGLECNIRHTLAC